MSDSTKSPEDRVQARAYELWEQDGKPEGRSAHHWHQARLAIEQEEAEAASGGSQASGAASGRARRTPKSKDPHPGMMGDGTEEQNLDQEGDPAARITEADVQEAFKASQGDT